MAIPFAASMALAGGLWLFLTRTFGGPRHPRGGGRRAGAAPSCGRPGAHPSPRLRIGIASRVWRARSSWSSARWTRPTGRLYIGRVFAIVVLGGMGSLGGTVCAALLLGVAESVTATISGPSWAPAVAFGFLLFALAVRPSGLFGR